jgi:AP-4 complex subunit epsilon-1
MSTGGTNLSKEFFELLKAIGESKSKQEEDRIIMREIQTLKKKIETYPTVPGQPTAPNTLLNSKRRAKEFLVRLLYVEMLGHDASFGYIKAVELTASASLYHKRTGYLVCGACLSPTHEFRFMLVNQMQRDLQSSHVLEICGGLLACTKIITGDMVPAVSGEVMKLIEHGSETVRKKAIICLHRCHQIAPEAVTENDMVEKLRKVLCDRDPSVMGCSLSVIEAMALSDTTPFKDLIPSLVSILKQVCEHRLPADFEYHRVPAPWIQIKIVRILGLLGRNDATASSGIYEILHECMKKADIGINAGYAIVYECIRTIVAIYPNTTLLDAAGEAISRFMQSRAQNLKYLGVTGLAAIVETHPQYAAAHQMAVMDCLEDADETLQRKTLDLLYRMTNPVNIEFIAEKMLEFLRGTTDTFLKKVLTKRICSVAERYAPNNAWYIRTITDLFEISGDLVKQEVAQNLMSMIAEGTGESEEADMLLRQSAIEMYVSLLKEKPASKLPRILLETMAWCLGEYGYLSAVSSVDDIIEDLCNIVAKAKIHASTSKFLISAIMKLVAQAGSCPPHAASVIDDFTKSHDIEVQQRCLEFQSILTSAPHLLAQVLPVDASAEDIQVDANLTFLDQFVHEASLAGANPYCKPEDDDDDDDEMYLNRNSSSKVSAFNLTPYEKPTKPATNNSMILRGIGSGSEATAPSGVSLPPGAGYGSSGNAIAAPVVQNTALQLNTRNVANVWGKGGLTQAPGAPPPPVASGAFGSPAPPSINNPVNSFAEISSPQGNPTHYGGNSNPFGNHYDTPAQPSVTAEKTPEQLQKERMAAALFGGVIPGQAHPPPPIRPTKSAIPIKTSSPSKSVPFHTVAAVVPQPAPVPAPEIDLLDIMSFDPNPSPIPPTVDALDIFAPHPVSVQPQVVENASDDEQIGNEVNTTQSNDPFDNALMFGGITNPPLSNLALNSKIFEYNGQSLIPLAISTPQFGQHWGSCSETLPASIQSNTIKTLEQLMNAIADVGAFKVESIAATNEGICAGKLAGSMLVLIHGKVSPTGGTTCKIDIIVKSTDRTLGSKLSLYLQTILK